MVLFPPSPGGGEEVDIGYKGKGVLTHLMTDFHGMPLSFTTTSAKGDERKELVKLIACLPQKKRWSLLYADKGYDANWLRTHLLQNNIYPVIDRRKYKHRCLSTCFLKKLGYRWKIERTFAWLKRKYRRIQTRWERKMC